MTFTNDDDGKKYEVISEPKTCGVYIIKPIGKEAEKKMFWGLWFQEMGKDEAPLFDKLITEPTAKAIADFIKAGIELIQIPFNEDTTRVNGNHVKNLAEQTRKLYQAEKDS